MSYKSPVAVSGIGCVCSGGSNLVESVDDLFHGTPSPASPVMIQSDQPIPYPVFEVQGELDEPRRFKKAEVFRTCRLLLGAAREALGDAEFPEGALSGRRVGVCIGTTVSSSLNSEGFYRDYRHDQFPGMDRVSRFLNSNPAAFISREFNLSGPCQTIVNACSSGGDAVGTALDWIRSGFCDVVLAGGADELCRVTYNGFISLKITDSAPCKPFDKNRMGLNLGEGAAVMVLESDRSIEMRNKLPRSYVLGYGAACDAHHLTAPVPDGSGLKKAILEALGSSGIDPAEIAFINAHGTGTPDNDQVESLVLGELLPNVPFFSTKGKTGHTLGAAGAIEAAFTAACLEKGKIPASAGFETPDPGCPVSPVNRETDINGRMAISESLAFGGNNAVLIIGREKT